MANTITSCHWLVASRFCDCCHRDVRLHGNVFCDCGHRELHRLPTSPPHWWLRPQIFDTAVHGVDEPTETLSPFSASGRPPNTTCPDTWPWEQKTCCLCTVPLETGLLIQSSMTLRSSTNDERCERALHGQKICPTNTWDEKHCNIIINCRRWKPRRNTQAMTILCGKHKQWRYSAGNTSNGDTLRDRHCLCFFLVSAESHHCLCFPQSIVIDCVSSWFQLSRVIACVSVEYRHCLCFFCWFPQIYGDLAVPNCL